MHKKRIAKKITALLLSGFLAVSISPVSAMADEGETSQQETVSEQEAVAESQKETAPQEEQSAESSVETDKTDEADKANEAEASSSADATADSGQAAAEAEQNAESLEQTDSGESDAAEDTNENSDSASTASNEAGVPLRQNVLRAASTKLTTYDDCKADFIRKNGSFQFMTSDDFNAPYQAIVNENENNKTYMALIKAWFVANLSVSEISEYSKKSIGYYEQFLYDILYTGSQEDGAASKVQAELDATGYALVAQVSELSQSTIEETLKTDASKLSEDDVKNLTEKLAGLDELDEVTSVLGDYSKALGYVSTLEDFFDRLAKCEYLAKLGDDYAEVVEDIGANTNDPSLKAACTEMATICRGTLTQEELLAVFAGKYAAGKLEDKVLGQIWSAVVEKANLYGLAIKTGQAVGKFVAGKMFSTDQSIETFYEMRCLCKFQESLRKLLRTYSDSKKFNAAAEIYMKSMILGLDMSVSYVGYIYQNGASKASDAIFNCNVNKDTYETYKKHAENLKHSVRVIIYMLENLAYEDYRDMYPELAATESASSAAISADSATESSTLATIKNDLSVVSDVTYTVDTTLSADMETFGNLYLKSGTLDLNGHKLIVHGTVYQPGGTMYLDCGELDVDGNYYQTGDISHDGDGNPSYGRSDGYLEMVKSTDVLRIGGEYATNSKYDHRGYLTAGTMYVGGDFTEVDPVYDYDSSAHNFDASGSHRVVLNGQEAQHLYFEKNDSGFANVTFSNPNIIWDSSSIRAFPLEEDINLKLTRSTLAINGTWDTSGHGLGKDVFSGIKNFEVTSGTWILPKQSYAINGNLTLSGGALKLYSKQSYTVAGKLTMSGGTLDLNGAKMGVSGTVYQPGGTMYLDCGELDVDGNYYQTGDISHDGDGNPSYGRSDGYLEMVKSTDVLRIGGEYATNSKYDHRGYLTAGTMYVGGDFTEVDPVYDYDSSAYNFDASGSHRVVLNGPGGKVQKVTFASSSSKFNVLVLTKDKDTGYTFNPDNCWVTLMHEDPPTVDKISVSPESTGAVRGGSVSFSAKVTGKNNPDLSVVWSVSGNASKSTTIAQNGTLKIGSDEANRSLTVTATSKADPKKIATAKVTVRRFTDVDENQYFNDAVSWGSENSVVTGFKNEDGTYGFRPDDRCTRAQFVSFLWRAMKSPQPSSMNNPFVDIANISNQYYGSAVLWASENKIVVGYTYPEGVKFGPDDSVTRGQAVTFLWRAAGCPTPKSNKSQFKDVQDPANHYYGLAMIWASENGIVSGYSDGKGGYRFAPDDTCTRGQVVTFLYRYAQKYLK